MARFAIGAGGEVVGSSAARSSGFTPLESAVACVLRRLEFVPGRRDGHAVEAEVMLPIAFRLH